MYTDYEPYFSHLDMLKQLPKESESQEEFLILASGGVDSSTLLWLSVEQGLKPTALFVDFGQPAAEAESEAVADICGRLGVAWRVVRYSGANIDAGEIRGRNAFLLHLALLEFPSNSGVVALGIHAGTGYTDCSPEFMEVIQRSYEFHTRGAINATAPFLYWTKQDVYHLASAISMPVALTYSCEADNFPCQRCRSCLDRRFLVPGPFEC